MRTQHDVESIFEQFFFLKKRMKKGQFTKSHHIKSPPQFFFLKCENGTYKQATN